MLLVEDAHKRMFSCTLLGMIEILPMAQRENLIGINHSSIRINVLYRQFSLSLHRRLSLSFSEHDTCGNHYENSALKKKESKGGPFNGPMFTRSTDEKEHEDVNNNENNIHNSTDFNDDSYHYQCRRAISCYVIIKKTYALK